MITLFSDEKICFWVITVNLTRHWGGDKRGGRTITWRPGMIPWQEVHRHDLFGLSLSPFKISFPLCVDRCSVHSGDANKCNIKRLCHFYFKNLISKPVFFSYSRKEIRKISLHFTLTDDGCPWRNRFRKLNQNERDRWGKMRLHHFHQNMEQLCSKKKQTSPSQSHTKPIHGDK